MGGGYSQPVASREITMAAILEAAAAEFRVSVEELKGHNRKRHLAYTRQSFFWLAHKMGKWSSVQIGRALGGKDHATVLYGIARASERMEINAAYAAALTKLWSRFTSSHPELLEKLCPHCGNVVN